MGPRPADGRYAPLDPLSGAELDDDPEKAALLAGQAALESGDPARTQAAREALLEASEHDPRAAWLVAYALLEGVGGERDPTGGVALLERAARGGVVDAGYELGRLLARGGQRDDALPWLTWAADRGHAGALRALGREAARTGDRDAAERLLRAAAAQGSPQAGLDLLLLLAEFGPTDELIPALDAGLRRGEAPPGLLEGVAALLARRDPDRVLDAAVTVVAQSWLGRRAFVDGVRAAAPALFADVGADLERALDVGPPGPAPL